MRLRAWVRRITCCSSAATGTQSPRPMSRWSNTAAIATSSHNGSRPWTRSCTPAPKETFGLVILEAMACGRPVVAARAGAVPEIVDESVGMLAKPCDGESMAETIAALYDRDIEAVGAAARARVLKQFTWSPRFTAEMNAYASLVGARRVHRVPARRRYRAADRPPPNARARARRSRVGLSLRRRRRAFHPGDQRTAVTSPLVR